MSVLVEPGHNNSYPFNHARILYESVATGATATGAEQGFPAASVLTNATYERWRPSATGQSVTVTFAEQSINAIALAAHSGLDPSIEVQVGGVWEPITPYPAGGPSLLSDFSSDDYGLLDYSPDNEAMLWLLKPRVATAIKIAVQYAGTAPTLGVVLVGTALEMQRPFYGGHQPAMLTSDTVVHPNVSESGEWLGASQIRKGRSVSMTWDHLDAGWVRRYWQPFAKNIKTSPFVVAWNPLEFPADCLYCSSDQQPAPSNSGPGSLQSVSMRARGYSDGTDPNVRGFESVEFDEMWEFTRGSSAKYFDVNGIMRDAGVDEPRIDHDPLTGEQLGLIVEEQRTNLILESEGFTSPQWLKSGTISVTDNVIVSPDGLTTADEVENTTEGVASILFQNSATSIALEAYAASVFVKPGTSSICQIGVWVFDDIVADVVVDLAAGTVSPKSGATGLIDYGIRNVGEGWYRVHCVGRANIGGKTVRPRFWPVGPAPYVVGSVYFWGAQLEVWAQGITSYIKTSASQVTRAAEVCKRALGAEFHSAEGTLFIDKINARPSSYAVLAGTGLTVTNGNVNFGYGANPIEIIADSKMAIRYKDGVGTVYINGKFQLSAKAQDAYNLGTLYVGSNTNSQFHANQTTKAVKFFPYALTDLEMRWITT